MLEGGEGEGVAGGREAERKGVTSRESLFYVLFFTVAAAAAGAAVVAVANAVVVAVVVDVAVAVAVVVAVSERRSRPYRERKSHLKSNNLRPNGKKKVSFKKVFFSSSRSFSRQNFCIAFQILKDLIYSRNESIKKASKVSRNGEAKGGL